MIISRSSLRSANVGYNAAACLLCQWRSFSTSYRQLAEKPPATDPSPSKAPSKSAPPDQSAPTPKGPAPPLPESPLQDAPRAYGKSVEEFTPKPLSRPIGLPYPPKSGENSGIDTRTLKQRRDDFVDYDKHLARRKELTHKVSTPYFREWSNMRFHKGKSFLAPPRIFKSDLSLYFPNLQGQTLLEDKESRDTTPVFQDKVTVVSIFNTQWAENQAATFVSQGANPELHTAIQNSGGIAQMVQINFEENWMKAKIIKMFMSNLRKRLGRENWGRYFLVQRGLTEEMRDAIGYLNSKVGYTYVLDGDCRIRWAGSGPSEGDEKGSLVKAVTRLVDNAKAKQNQKATVSEKPVDKDSNLAGNEKVATTGE